MKNIFGRASSEAVKRGNVMTPLNWMCGLVEIVLIPTAATCWDNWLGKATFILAALLMVFYAVMFIFFAIRNPDRLQTEQYNLERHEMALQYTGEAPKILDASAKIT